MKDIFILPTDTCYGIGCVIWDSHAYQKIYEIKNRGYDKPLAIMVRDLDWLYDNTDLSEGQLNFISEYERPYTVLANCPRISLLLNYEDEDTCYPNKEQYEKIAFRVAHTPLQKLLIEEQWPIFLTSANISGWTENYTIQDLKNDFKNYLEEVEILEEKDLDNNIQPSDIFEFVWEGLEIKYLRKN